MRGSIIVNELQGSRMFRWVSGFSRMLLQERGLVNVMKRYLTVFLDVASCNLTSGYWRLRGNSRLPLEAYSYTP